MTIGGFEIVERLGAGGMGEVYRARDTRLGREVAIKILPAALAAEPGRLERLAREARTLASLNHPNIAAIYGVEPAPSSGPGAGAPSALILELVEGETLAARIARKPLTLPEARAVSRQIVAAFDAAHACGIVHRDLKPENVMLGARGVVKVLDFGIAKAAVDARDANTGTISAGPTADGSVIGTLAYMSPEQARGLPVDRRTDIWAFGCVLFEMLTGRRAFSGETASDILVATLERDPDWAALPPETPRAIRRLLARTLQKDPHDRLRDIADALADLDETADPESQGAGTAGTWLPWTIAAVALSMSGWLLVQASRRPPLDPIAQSVLTPITRDAGFTTAPALSRDGRLLAYASDRAGGGTLDIWVQIAGGAAVRLTDDEADDTAPDFSPDGSRILFQSDRHGGGAYEVSALGTTPPRLVARGAREPRYSPDGTRIAYVSGPWRGGIGAPSGLYVVALAGGRPQRLAPDFRSVRAPVWAPDGKSLLFLGRSDASVPLADSLDWWWAKLDGSPPVKVGVLADPDFRQARAQPSAWTSSEVLFSDAKDLWSVPVSQTTGRMLGRPRRLTVSAGAYRLPAIGPDGRIVFASTQDYRVIERAPLETSARSPLQLYSDFAANTGRPSQTRDARMIVFERPSIAGIEIWTRDLPTGVEQLITRVDARTGVSATVSPDGGRIAYTVLESESAVGTGFVVETARGVPAQVCARCTVTGFLSDGRRLLAYSGGTVSVHDVVTGTSVDAVTASEGFVNRPHASPDDRWLTFRAGPDAPDDTGHSFLTPLTPGRPQQRRAWIEIDRTPGGRPAGWSPDGRTIYLLLDTDGFRCLWGVRIAANGQPLGPAAPIRHFHGADWTEMSTSYGNPFSSDGFLYGTIRRRGNVWSLVRQPRP